MTSAVLKNLAEISLNVSRFVKDDYDLFFSERHPLTKDWAFMEPKYLILSMLAYSLMCIIGVQVIQRNNYNMDYKLVGFMRVYNVVQVLCNMFIFHQSMTAFLQQIENNDRITCLTSRPDKPITYADYIQARALWCYYMTKFLDFVDTGLIILRGRWRQLSFLHCYHHLSVCLITWIPLSFVPYGQCIHGVLFNSFIHCVMYSYYFLSSYPSLWRYLWWKQYLTQLQIIQFMSYITFMVMDAALIIQGSCRMVVSFLFNIGTIGYAFSMFSLFMTFYRSSYNKAKKED